MGLNRVDLNGPEGPGLLIAHGLFGSARNWAAMAKRISAGRSVRVVDMRNHGQSPWFDSHSYEEMAADLIAELQPGSDLLGHSMGGKAAMVAALTRPDAVRRLVVLDIAPVAYTHSHAGHIGAMRGLDLSALETRRDADKALAAAVPDDGVRAFLLQSLDLSARRWRLNLDILEAEMPSITGFPDVEGAFGGPTLFLCGGASDYVRPEHRTRIKDLFPRARFARIPQAGHWLHAEKPAEVAETVSAFLSA